MDGRGLNNAPLQRRHITPFVAPLKRRGTGATDLSPLLCEGWPVGGMPALRFACAALTRGGGETRRIGIRRHETHGARSWVGGQVSMNALVRSLPPEAHGEVCG